MPRQHRANIRNASAEAASISRQRNLQCSKADNMNLNKQRNQFWLIVSIAMLSTLTTSTTRALAEDAFGTEAMEGAYEFISRDAYLSVKIIDWADALSGGKRNTVAFSQKVLSNSGCQGMVRGFATAVSSTRLVLKHKENDSICSLTIDFRREKDGSVSFIRVTEEDCSYYHGQRCSFSGTLKRKVD
jgi:hypothetical protein